MWGRHGAFERQVWTAMRTRAPQSMVLCWWTMLRPPNDWIAAIATSVNMCSQYQFTLGSQGGERTQG